MNNDTFNFNRFGKYFSVDFKSFINRYGLSLLILSCSGLFVYLFKLILRITFLNADVLSEELNGDYSINGIFSRVFVFFVFLAITAITAPKKCYGNITNKKEGSSFLLLPASRLEKYLSMLIITCIIIPLIYISIHLGIDECLCFFDNRCGKSIATFHVFESFIKFNDGNFITLDDGSKFDILQFDVIKPYMLIDDVLSIILFFLLGALIFKRTKIAKTIGSYLIISTMLSMVFFLPFYLSNIKDIIVTGNDSINQFSFDSNDITLEAYDKIVVLIKKCIRFDFISDTVTNISLLVGIWFRLKTIKH